MNILDKLRQKPILVRAQEAALTSTAQHVPKKDARDLRSLFVKPPTTSHLLEKPSLKDKVEKAKRAKNPHGYAEISRIVKLPMCWPLTDKELEAYSRDNILANQYEKGFRLKERQAMCLLSYELFGGVFGPVAVGGGKTLVTVGIASKAYEKGQQKILLVVPPQVYGQLVMSNLSWIRNRIPVRVPMILMGNLAPQKRHALAVSKRPGCYILPYSCLSTKDSVELLQAIQPTTIILDEAHRVSARRTARTKRLMNYVAAMQEQGTEVEFIALSGTITRKTIMEYHHLIRQALKENCPLPLSPQMASEWGQYVDAKAAEYKGEFTGSVGPIQHIIDWAQRNFPSKEFTRDVTGFREAYKVRLQSAPGVVSSGDNELGVSLTLRNTKAPQPSEKLSALMDKVVDEFLTPDGDQIEHAIHTFKWLFELSAGFYNRLFWPTSEVLAKRRKISSDQAAEMLETLQQHHDLKQIFNKELRNWLSRHSHPKLDTPLLVMSDMMRNGKQNVSAELYAAWKDMKALEFEKMPERDSEAVRVDDFKIKHALEWEKERRAHKDTKGKGAIIWCYNQEIVQWAGEVFEEAGFDPLVCDAGEKSNAALDWDRNPQNAERTVIASYSAHGEGKNLQHFQYEFFIQWPRPAHIAEQVLGRLHRTGQEADEIVACTCHTTMFDHLNFAACLNDALYIQQTTGNAQRIIYAGYDPLPTIFPPQVLRERGLQAKMLSLEQQQVMQELFGGPSNNGKK